MLKLALKLAALGWMVAAALAILIWITPHDSNNYLAAAEDKRRLLYLVKSPRIILVGGSNLAFSVDSERIERRFGLPVVNMGLHGDVGLRFMLNEIEPAVGRGDIILIFPEYEHFYDLPLDGFPRELGSVIKFCADCISAISTPKQFLNVATGILQTSEGDILRVIGGPEKPDKVYFRQGFNQRGDLVSHLKLRDKSRPNNHVSDIQVISPNPAVELLNSFYGSSSEAQARVFLMFPAIPIDEYNAQKNDFVALYDLLRNDLEIPILGTPQDFIYPEDYFYDTVYHMNGVGRDARTDRIMELLSATLHE